MSAPSGQFFFVSYSRADTTQQRKIVAELRGRGVNVWVDTENLVPGSPAWEREIEKSIRGASGVIVLLSPDSNNSQWVRREISFAEENDKQIFPVHIAGDENDSIPLRLSSHQRVDLRRNFTKGLDELADALKDHLGVTAVIKRPNLKKNQQTIDFPRLDWKKFALPGTLAVVGLFCIVIVFFAARAISRLNNSTPPANPTDSPPAFEVTMTATKAQPGGTEPTGKIVYTCGIAGDEICLINPDGSGWQRLTNTNQANSNASLAPDGNAIVYIRSDGGKTEIYEMNLVSGNTQQLTDLGQNVGSPEISPDNQHIIFHYRPGNSNVQLWIMDRDGGNPREFFHASGRDVHDATWSSDGTQLLFALGRAENNQLYIMNFNSGEPVLVNDTIDTRGRSDWSVNDLISFDQGGPFQHDVFLMDASGNNLHLVGPGDMNSQGASLSPDGNWIAFSAYTNVAGQDQNSCEIFIMRADGTDLRQLTDNNYCDYQARWGN